MRGVVKEKENSYKGSIKEEKGFDLTLSILLEPVFQMFMNEEFRTSNCEQTVD